MHLVQDRLAFHGLCVACSTIVIVFLRLGLDFSAVLFFIGVEGKIDVHIVGGGGGGEGGSWAM